MEKVCKCCGKIIKDDEDYTLVNSGMPEEFVQCWACHTSDMDNGKVLQCESCGEYFSADVLHDEEIGGDSFCECPNCGCDIVEGTARADFEDEHYLVRYAVTVRSVNSVRGYVVSVRPGEGTAAVIKKLAEKVDLSGLSEISCAEILLEEDEF